MRRREFLALLCAVGGPAWAAGPKRKKGKAVPPDRWAQLTPEQQAAAQTLWVKFKALPPERQTRLREAFARYQKLGKDEQAHLQKGLPRWASLKPEQQDRFRKQIREWNAKTPGERRLERIELLRGKEP